LTPDREASAGEKRDAATKSVFAEGEGSRCLSLDSGKQAFIAAIQAASDLTDGAIIRVKVRFKDHVISLDAFNNSAQAPPQRGEQTSVSFAPADLQVLVDREAMVR
jgi:putative protein kinase ArgK-like GTPase of G3E family